VAHAPKELDPLEIEGYHVELRPIAQRLVDDLLKDPIAFLEQSFGLFGVKAGHERTS